jgi:hypothetical protein
VNCVTVLDVTCWPSSAHVGNDSPIVRITDVRIPFIRTYLNLTRSNSPIEGRSMPQFRL